MLALQHLPAPCSAPSVLRARLNWRSSVAALHQLPCGRAPRAVVGLDRAAVDAGGAASGRLAVDAGSLRNALVELAGIYGRGGAAAEPVIGDGGRAAPARRALAHVGGAALARGADAARERRAAAVGDAAAALAS